MSEYEYYLAYRNAHDQIAERVEQTRRTRIPGRPRRHPGRHALAKRLHALADRIDD